MRLDVTEARRAPGVVAVLTADELNPLLHGEDGGDGRAQHDGARPGVRARERRALLRRRSVRAGGRDEPRAGRGCDRPHRPRGRAVAAGGRLRDRDREPGARARSVPRHQPRERVRAARRRRAPRDLRVGGARRHRDVRAEPLPGGADGGPRHRRVVGPSTPRVRRLGLHAIAARRPHRDQPHHRRARAADPRAHGRRRRRLRPEGVPRARRADRAPRRAITSGSPSSGSKTGARTSSRPRRRAPTAAPSPSRPTPTAGSSGSRSTISTTSARTRSSGAPAPWPR